MNNEKYNINIYFLEQIAHALGELNSKVVFVGGAITQLYIDDKAVTDFRPTKDIDCVIEIISDIEHRKFEKQLRKLGFIHPASYEENIICRWKYNEIFVDFMPTNEKILGFTNLWYADGINNAQQIILPSNITVKIFKLEYFISSKIEAFKNRGNNDFYGSHDLEDIITVLDGRINIMEEWKDFDKKVLIYLAIIFSEWLYNSKFISALPGLLTQNSTNSARKERILNLLKKIAGSS